jgi:polyisoprenoid-binding protein YceI
MKKLLTTAIVAIALTASTSANAEKYAIDTKGAHAFVQFKIKHLGYSWLYGRFNEFDGSFNIDRENLENSSISVDIKTASVDSNHAERDKHLRSDDFLDTDKFPDATFKSTALKLNNDTSGVMTGELTLHGVTKPIDIAVKLVGEGKDPWGGYRTGFEGTTTFKLKDFNIEKDLGPASAEIEMILSIEGIRQ